MPTPPCHRELAAGGASLPRRLAWLLVCLIGGGLVGGAGQYLTGEKAWFLAVPIAVAVGWLFLADPSRCEVPAARRGSDAGHDDSGSR